MTEIYQVRISDSISLFSRQLWCVITFTDPLIIIIIIIIIIIAIIIIIIIIITLDCDGWLNHDVLDGEGG